MRQCTECGETKGRIIKYQRKTDYCWGHYLQMRRHGHMLKRTKYTPNRFLDCGSYIAIELFNMKDEQVGRALVDIDMLPKVRRYKWHVAKRKHIRYAETIMKDGLPVMLHVFVLGRLPNKEIDHRNGDGLDCRRQNLRHVTHFQNVLNKHSNIAKSGHIGVAYRQDRRCWVARIVEDGKLRQRYFRTKAEAIRQRLQWEHDRIAA